MAEGSRMKKVLIITYLFPPLGGVGVQRTIKFVKYLPNYGWQPIVLTVKKPEYWIEDPSLETEIPKTAKVYRTASFELEKLHNIIKNLLETLSAKIEKFLFKKINLINAIDWRLKKFFSTINSWLFIPDRKIGWLPFAMLRGWWIIKKEKIDVIFTTSPPNSVHLIGYLLKKLTGKPLVVDFRDPWTQGIYWNPVTEIHKKIEEFMENAILRSADKVISVLGDIGNDLMTKYSLLDSKRKFITIPNGFDPDDFKVNVNPKNSKFTITYTGVFYGRQTPLYFLNALRELIDERKEIEKEIQVIFVGKLSNFYKDKIKQLSLNKIVKYVGYVPHQKSIEFILNSDVLLLIIGSGEGSDRIYTGKIFEYLAANKPILALIPEGAAANLIALTKSGVVVPPENVGSIKQAIYNLYLRHKVGDLKVDSDRSLIQKYDRKKLTKDLADVFEGILHPPTC